MFDNRYRLGVGLMTLFVFAFGLPSVRAQVAVLPTDGDGWACMAGALDPETDDVMVVGAGVTSMGEFVAASVSYSGALNKAFGGGLVATDVTGLGAANWPYACAVDSEGRLLSGGLYTYETGKGKNLVVRIGFALVRYDTTGALDKTFNKTGIAKTNFKFNTGVRAIAVQSDGGIVVAGSYTTNNSPLTLARYLPTGVLDSSFGAGGTVSTTLPVEAADVNAVALQSDGSIVVAIQFYPASGPRSMALMRYTAGGMLDTSFGNNGIAAVSLGGQSSYLNDLVVINASTDGGDSTLDDSIVVAGECGNNLAVVRFTANGTMDATFAAGGYVTENWGSTAYSVALQSNGAIVIAGVASNGNMLIARFDQDGAVDATFGSTGGVFNGQGYADDFAYPPQGTGHAVFVQSTGQIVAVGQSDGGVNAVVSYTANGTPNKSF